MIKFPQSFRLWWWIILLGIFTSIGYARYSAFRNGTASAADIIIVLLWFALALVPVFNEINLFGIGLKQEIEDLKREMLSQMLTLQSQIQNTVGVNTQVNPNIYVIPSSPSVDQLPALQRRIDRAVQDAAAARGVTTTTPAPPPQEVLPLPHDIAFLFQARYNLEQEVRRIYESVTGPHRRRLTLGAMATNLDALGAFEPSLADAIRQIYTVCTPALHGEIPSPQQVTLVRNTLPEVLRLLEAIPATHPASGPRNP